MSEPNFSQLLSPEEIVITFYQFCSRDINSDPLQMELHTQSQMPPNNKMKFSVGNNEVYQQQQPSSLSSPVDNCVICGDKASGKHYGVISCEGCKGFFKRSVRRQVRYVCKDGYACPMDPRQRTRCQYCRFKSCLQMGMRTEAVQEERHTPGKGKSRQGSWEQGSLDAGGNELTMASLLAAELLFEVPATGEEEKEAVVYVDIAPPTASSSSTAPPLPLVIIAASVESQLSRLVDSASCIPAFKHQLSHCDQLALLKFAWSELLLISLAYRSMAVSGGLLFASRHHLSLETAAKHGLGPLTNRLEREIVSKFRDIALDRTELAILKAILLFNPDASDISVEGKTKLEKWRDELYAGLHSYCTASRVDGRVSGGSARFTKLLLRLAPLRSISMKCLEYLVFAKLTAEDPTSQRLLDLIEKGVWPSVTP